MSTYDEPYVTITEADFSEEEINVINSVSPFDILAIVGDKFYRTECEVLGYDLFQKYPYNPKQPSRPKKRKFQHSTNTEIGSCSSPKPKKARAPVRVQAPPSPPELPVEYKDKIAELGGSDTRLVIQKKLYTSDIDKVQARLTMSYKQCKVDLNEHLGPVKVIYREDDNWSGMRMTLSKWETVSSFLFNGYWNDLVVAYNLKKNDVVQVWCFRDGDQLSFALVKLR